MLPIQDLHTATTATQIEVLDQLFEPCATLQKLVLPTVQTAFPLYSSFIEEVRIELFKLITPELDDARIDKIIAAHPRLGAPKQVKLLEHSSSEQKSLGSDPVQTQKLVELNDEYEKTFPGLRYVVFVNGRSREVVMEDMRRRIGERDKRKEVEEAFNAMCDIAKDRLGESVRA